MRKFMPSVLCGLFLAGVVCAGDEQDDTKKASKTAVEDAKKKWKDVAGAIRAFAEEQRGRFETYAAERKAESEALLKSIQGKEPAEILKLLETHSAQRYQTAKALFASQKAKALGFVDGLDASDQHKSRVRGNTEKRYGLLDASIKTLHQEAEAILAGLKADEELTHKDIKASVEKYIATRTAEVEALRPKINETFGK